MWSPLGNSSGLHSYVSKAHGWEFVAHSRPDSKGDRQRSRSPLRGAHAAFAGHFSGQPTSDRALHELQSQHSRLRKRFEEQRRRHAQEKDGWMKEKEMLLREMADVQGGENRRILLGLKTVLEEVQSEVKREEGRRTELQLQYTKDRCQWERERAELECRIAQSINKEWNVCGTTNLLPKLGLPSKLQEQARRSCQEHTGVYEGLASLYD